MQRFYKEVIAWKAFDHPNVVPLLGVSENRSQLEFVMVSEWMANGNINQFMRAHWDANRFKLVGFLYRALPSSSVTETCALHCLTTSYPG